jgi:hypothetical protein
MMKMKTLYLSTITALMLFTISSLGAVFAQTSSNLSGLSSDFFISGRIVPNATIPVGLDFANEGNFTLYTVHFQFVDSPLLQNFQTSFGNFTLKVGQEKTITGIIFSPSKISNVQSNFHWIVYATNQNGTLLSKEFTRLINLTNISRPEYSMSYDALLPPLKQDGPVNYVVCKKDFQLIIKSENYTAACVTPNTEEKLVIRGWGETLEGLMEPPAIKKMEIIGLQQHYKIGQSIHATIKYTGWGYDTTPEMKIFDSNGTQIWFNCPDCVAHTELAIQYPGIFTTFTYPMKNIYGNYPSINKTGSYTLVTSLGNETAKFDVDK